MTRAIRVKFLWLFVFFPHAICWADPLSVKIDEILKGHQLDRGRISCQFVRLADGQILYEKGSDRALNPASVAKLVTAAAALKTLGNDYRWKIEFYTRGRVRGGGVRDLWIKGYGDPYFVTEALSTVTHAFQELGVRRIEGDLYVDDTHFDREEAVTYLSFDDGRTYRVATNPLSFNFNTLEIVAHPSLQPGEPPTLELKPPTRYVTLVNQVRTSSRPSVSLRASQSYEQGERRLTLKGSLPARIREYSFRQGVGDPAIFTGTMILEALQGVGVTFVGKIRRREVPDEAHLLWAYESPTLASQLNGLGKHSNNFMAEQILKSMGAARFGPPGTVKKGRAVVSNYLSSLGVSPGQYFLENGSGLSRYSRIRAADLVKVLQDQYRSPWREDFISSLSVSGINGTLENRFRGRLRGKVFAKTGTLRQVSALAGYLVGDSDPVAFAILVNDFPGSTDRVIRAQGLVLEAVLESLRSGGST